MKTNTTTWIRNRVAGSLNPVMFDAFVRGLIPGFQIPNFISEEDARAIAKRVEEFVEDYKSAPGVGKAGEALVEYDHDFDAYAAHSAVWMDEKLGLRERKNLVDMVSGYLTLNTALQVKQLCHGPKLCYAGIFRKINSGAGNHLDILPQDCNAFKDRTPKMQASVVLHLSVPTAGGETIIWDRRPSEEDKQFMIDSWQYEDKLFEGLPNVTIPCVTGELVILSTMNYHKVNPSVSLDSDRISFSFFIVVFEEEPQTIYIYN